MKVYLGKPKNWFGPYQLAQAILFWVKKEKDEYGFPHTSDRVHKFGEFLAYGSIKPEPKPGDIFELEDNRKETWLYSLLSWIDSKKKKKVKVRIDPWDTWSMDYTLAHIILPMLKQLKETKHGSPYVDFDDVPENLRPDESEQKEHSWDTDSKYHDRWDYVLNEMIFAFEHKLDESWRKQFEPKDYKPLQLKMLEDGNSQIITNPDGYDWDGMKAYEARIQNGFRLFGRYYQSLWD